MSEVSFAEGIDLDDARAIAAHARPLEVQDFERVYDSVYEGIVDGIMVSAKVVTAFIDDTPAAVFGFSNRDESGWSAPWLVLTTQAEKRGVTVIRAARKWIKANPGRFRQLVNWVPVEDKPAQKFLVALGFTVETEEVYEQHGGEYYAFHLKGNF